MEKAEKQKKKLDKDQSERFKETARQLGVDETGERFEASFTKIVAPALKKPKR